MTEAANEPQDLIKIEPQNALDIFSTTNGLDPYLSPLKEIVSGFHGDASTDKGRKEIKSFCYKLARSKTYIDNIGKDLVADLKQKPKLIDAERKRVRELIDAWSAECRQPLSDYEKIEQDRIDGIKASIGLIQSAIDKMDLVTEHDVLDNLYSNKTNLADFDPQEFRLDYHNTLEALDHKYESRKKAINKHLEELKQKMEADKRAEQERLERMAAESKAREEEASKRAVEAEQRAKEQAEALAKEREENRRQAAENLKIQQEQAARLAEQQKAKEFHDAKRQEEQETAERSRQKDHRNKILLEILEDIKNFIDEDSAKTITKAIIKGDVRNLKIIF